MLVELESYRDGPLFTKYLTKFLRTFLPKICLNIEDAIIIFLFCYGTVIVNLIRKIISTNFVNFNSCCKFDRKIILGLFVNNDPFVFSPLQR